MARLHHQNRYDRATNDVERVTGVPAQTIEESWPPQGLLPRLTSPA